MSKRLRSGHYLGQLEIRAIGSICLKWLKRNWPVVLAALALFGFALAVCIHLDPDLGWHLRVGEDLLNRHLFPRQDIYTFPFQGYAWRDHEWLAEVPLYLIYHYLGYPALVILFAGLWILPFWLVLAKQKIYNRLILVLLGLFLISSFIGVRLQVLTLVGLAILFGLFDLYHQKENKKLLYFFPLVMLLWANIHGSFVYGLLVGVIFLIYSLKNDWRRGKAFLLSYLTGLFITLVNPYGFGLWQEILIAADPAFKKLISEWLPLLMVPTNYILIVYLAIFILLALVNRRKHWPFPAYYLISVALFFVLALISRRNATILILLSLPVFLYLVKVDPVLSLIRTKKTFLLITGVSWSVVFFIAYWMQVIALWPPKNAFEGYFGNYPSANITQMLAKLPAGTHVFASYDYGGYLIQSNPNILVFIDGRGSYWRLQDRLAVSYYNELIKNPPQLEKAREQYDFDLILTGSLTSDYRYDLISRTDFSNSTWQSLGIYLIKNSQWRLVAKDQNNNQWLFVRVGSGAESILNR